MKSVIKDFAKQSLYAMGYYHLLRGIRRHGETRLLGLMYHDILDDERAADPGELNDNEFTANEFEAHLRVVTSNFPVLPLREAVERLRRGDLERDSVAVTFDDGYEAVYSVAFPLLRRYNTPATVFLVTDWIDNQKPCWWHRVRILIRRSDFSGVTPEKLRNALGIPFENFDGKAVVASARRRIARLVECSFRDLEDEEREKRLKNLEALLSFSPNDWRQSGGALTWNQVREMSAHGIDFEPHTCSHINIRHSSPAVVARELECSRRATEQQTGRKVTGFAYPYGKDLRAYTAIEPILREQGFLYAVTAQRGVNSRETHPYLLLRHSLPKTTSTALLHRSLILAFANSR
jgi:peptidoglycan/xylan/chitin deacetylase (PgdA/CDA1 family)